MFNFFRNKKEDFPSLTSFSVFKTDIHSHLIPGIDDGSKTMEDSLSFIRQMAALGFRKLVTTPHVMADHFQNTPTIILQGLEMLRNAISEANMDIHVEAAAEYYLDEGFTEMIRTKNLLTIGEKYVLFEISFMNPPENIMQVIFDLQIAGYKPLLAHPERYPFWHQRMDEYRKLKEAGTLFQLNTNSLCGYYGKGVKKTAEHLVDEHMIDFIGSDLHGQRHLDGLQKSLHEPYLHKLAAVGVKNMEL